MRKGLLLAFLARTVHAHHLPMTGVVLDAEVRFIHRIVDAHGIARLVEREAGLDFPGDILALVSGDIAARFPGLDHPIHGSAVVDAAVNYRGLDAIHANALNAQVQRKLGVLPELRRCTSSGRRY